MEAPGSIAAGPDTFVMRVRVLAATDAATPLAGARVSAGGAVGDLTVATTDSSGVATLRLRAPQVVALEVTADGFAGADTTAIHVGNETPGAGLGRATGQALVCVFTLGLGCPRDVTVRLPGAEGGLAVRLVPARLAVGADVPIPQGVSTPATGPPVVSVDVKYVNDSALAPLYAAQLVHADATLTWTNAPGSEADLDAALGCAVGKMQQSQQASPATLASLGPRSVGVSADVPPGCALRVGAVVESASTGLTAHADLKLAFGPGVQTPQVE